jgi:hypothetical protein
LSLSVTSSSWRFSGRAARPPPPLPNRSSRDGTGEGGAGDALRGREASRCSASRPSSSRQRPNSRMCPCSITTTTTVRSGPRRLKKLAGSNLRVRCRQCSAVHRFRGASMVSTSVAPLVKLAAAATPAASSTATRLGLSRRRPHGRRRRARWRPSSRPCRAR